MHHPTIGGSGSYAPPSPPPPTVEHLAQASGDEAGRAVEAMTPEQHAELTAEVEALPAAERTDLANALAAKLDAGPLQQLVPVFGQQALLDAVQTRSPASVRETFEQAVGAGPAVTTALDTTPSGRGEDAQVADAQSDYADQVEGQGILSQHALGELMTANAGDPAYLAELVRLAREDEVLGQVVDPLYGGLYEQSGGEYSVSNDRAAFDADARREAFALAVGAAIDRGTLTETDLRALGAQQAGWSDVAGRIGVGQVGLTEATTDTALALDGQVGDYQDAYEDVQRLDEELGGLLAQAGPMTPEQQAAFVAAFREDPENAPTYERLAEATTALSDYVVENREAVLDAAVRDPGVAATVRDALVGMAREGRGEEVISLLTEINAGGETSALAEAFAGFDELSGPVLEDAAAAAMTQLLERNNGDVSAAQAQFETLFTGLVQAWPAKAGSDDLRLGLSMLDAAGRGDVDALRVYMSEYDGKSPIARALGAAGVVAGAVGAANAGRNEDYVNMVAGFAQSGENAARLVAGAMGGMSAVGEAAQAAGRFGGAAGFAAKLAPGLGLVANAASLANSIDRASEGNPGYAVAAFGDVLGILGSALEFTPVAPAGFVVSGIGAVVSALGSFAGEIISGNQRRDDIERYLEAAGVDPSISTEMAASGKQLFEMAETLDLTPEQVQALLVAHPDIGGAPGLAGTFADVAAAAGVRGEDVIAFAGALAQERGDFAWDLMGLTQHVPTDAGEADAFWRDYVENNYPDAAAIAQEAAPDLYGEAAQQRETALADYNRASGSMSWEMEIANQLERNDDPAYRAEMLRLLADSGEQRLEMFAQMIGGYGEHWRGAVSDSVADALAAGTLTRSQADLVLGYF